MIFLTPLKKITEMTHFEVFFCFFVFFPITAVWFGGNGLLFPAPPQALAGHQVRPFFFIIHYGHLVWP